MLRDIVVHVDSTPEASSRLGYAAGFATLHQAHLTALHIRRPPVIPADVTGTSVAATVIALQHEAEEERAGLARKLVDEVSARYGLPIEWREAEGSANDLLNLHGYYSDLIVIGQSPLGIDLRPPVGPDAGRVIVTSGRPVIVVPKECPYTTFGQQILIAWKASAPAARAVADALPLLQKAHGVTVLEVTQDPVANRIAGADISTHLSRHGVKVTVEPFVAPDDQAFPLIQSRAMDIGADLIVMGGYGYPRLWEAVLGGVTRQMLGAMFQPVLFSH